NSGAFTNMVFHRLDNTSSLQVLQGGSFDFVGTAPNANLSEQTIIGLPTGQNVVGTSPSGTVVNTSGGLPSEFVSGTTTNTPATIAMALTSAGKDSGTSGFFFNLSDNSSSLDSQSFTTFGVLSDAQGNPLSVSAALGALFSYAPASATIAATNGASESGNTVTI